RNAFSFFLLSLPLHLLLIAAAASLRSFKRLRSSAFVNHSVPNTSSLSVASPSEQTSSPTAPPPS
ncbi:hypothetical protein L195_g049962, partial [Trifolium pratense]